AAVGDPDAQADLAGLEPADARRRPPVAAEGVVAEHLLGQAVLAEGVPEDLPGAGVGLVRAAPQGHEEPGVVVEDGERVDAAALDLDVPLEVQLPELVGFGPFEALDVRGRGGGRDAAVAPEGGGGGGAGARAS